MSPMFPDFKKLTLDDRQQYLRLVADYTPFSDISFTTLHIWWNLDEKLYFSVLDDNLVLNYSQPFDQAGAGLSLIGHHQIDRSIDKLFEFLKDQKRQPRLVHVPEFAVDKIEDRGRFLIEEEVDMHEYVMDAAACAKLEGPDLGRIRRKVNRFLREVEGHEVELKALDLGLQANRQLIISSTMEWQTKFPKANDPGRTEMPALQAAVRHHQALEIKNLCLFIDGKLHGVALYHQSHDGEYYTLNHLKVDYTFPFIFDYLTNQVAVKAAEHKVLYLNMEMDLGIEGLRQHKLGLRPIRFLKKYTIRL
ncbi:MAG TPA: phosphatidylglycerol lysyltransferase domain-containing protein [Candidatus Saccharimonadales bacterium]|nr:phosphatidylglycerol lysyltransferase domain-containing protein [Candidatus Saccharimonadales bacterium]